MAAPSRFQHRQGGNDGRSGTGLQISSQNSNGNMGAGGWGSRTCLFEVVSSGESF